MLETQTSGLQSGIGGIGVDKIDVVVPKISTETLNDSTKAKYLQFGLKNLRSYKTSLVDKFNLGEHSEEIVNLVHHLFQKANGVLLPEGVTESQINEIVAQSLNILNQPKIIDYVTTTEKLRSYAEQLINASQFLVDHKITSHLDKWGQERIKFQHIGDLAAIFHNKGNVLNEDSFDRTGFHRTSNFDFETDFNTMLKIIRHAGPNTNYYLTEIVNPIKKYFQSSQDYQRIAVFLQKLKNAEDIYENFGKVDNGGIRAIFEPHYDWDVEKLDYHEREVYINNRTDNLKRIFESKNKSDIFFKTIEAGLEQGVSVKRFISDTGSSLILESDDASQIPQIISSYLNNVRERYQQPLALFNQNKLYKASEPLELHASYLFAILNFDRFKSNIHTANDLSRVLDVAKKINEINSHRLDQQKENQWQSYINEDVKVMNGIGLLAKYSGKDFVDSLEGLSALINADSNLISSITSHVEDYTGQALGWFDESKDLEWHAETIWKSRINFLLEKRDFSLIKQYCEVAPRIKDKLKEIEEGIVNMKKNDLYKEIALILGTKPEEVLNILLDTPEIKDVIPNLYQSVICNTLREYALGEELIPDGDFDELRDLSFDFYPEKIVNLISKIDKSLIKTEVNNIYQILFKKYISTEIVYHDDEDNEATYHGFRFLDNLHQLQEITGITPEFNKKYILSLYEYCFSHGEQFHHKLSSISKETGVDIDDEFIDKYILNNSTFSTRIPYSITADKLEEHFSQPNNTTLSEYKRIYKVFGCYEYYQTVLSRLETSGTTEAKQQLVAILGAIALNEMDNGERYAQIKNRIIDFNTESNRAITKRIAEVLAALAQNGDIEVTNHLAGIIHKLASVKNYDIENQFLDFNKEQEIALRALLQLDNSTSNELLLALIFAPYVNPRIKKLIIGNLAETKNNFFPSKTKIWVESLLSRDSNNIIWDDLKFFHASLKIPSADIRNKSRQQIDEAFDMFDHESSISLIHHKMCSSVPNNVFMQLYAFTQGNELLLDKFNDLYRSMRGISQHEGLLFGIVNGLTVNKKIQDKVIGHLQNIEFSSNSSANDMAIMLKTVSFLDTVDKQLELREESKIFDALDLPVESLSGLNESLKSIVVKKIREVLPNDGISAEKIQNLWEQWGNLEPIFVYAGKMSTSHHEGTLQLVADMVAKMDAPSYEGWKKWRYNTDDRKVRAQIGFLSEEQTSVWKENHFAELGDILIATSPTDRPKQVLRHLQVAISEGHVYNPDIDTTPHYRFVQEQLDSTYSLISSAPEQKEAVIDAEIQRLQIDIQIIDNISRYGLLSRIQQAVTLLAKDQTIQLNKKTVDTIEFLSQFLSKEQAKVLQTTYSDAEKSGATSSTASAIFTPEILQALETKTGEIESGYTEALSTDIFERHGLDKTNLKNVGQFYQKRQEIKALMDLYRMSKLSTRLIATNRIAEKEDKKGETLSTVMEGLRKYFKDNPTFLQDLDNINETITQREGVGTNRRLAMIISDNPQMLFQVGKYPIGCGSCQNYEGSPDWNKSLAAYVADSHIKAMFLIDINKLPNSIKKDIEIRGFDEVKGSIGIQDMLEASVARAMTKIVKTENQDAALFIEPTYTQINKGDLSMNKYFDIFAELMVSEPMRIQLVRGGGSEKVYVSVSRNPSGQYEDCAAGDAGNAGMGIQTREYTMSARFINKFTPVSEEDHRIADVIYQSGSN